MGRKIALAVIAVSGCSGAPPKPNPEPQQTEPAAAAPSTPSSTLELIRDRGQIIVGVKEDSPPFGFRKENELYGFDIDLSLKIAEKLGLGPKDVKFVPVTAANRTLKLMAREVDLIAASMTITRAREKVVDFSIPYFATDQGFLVTAGSAIRGYEDLADKRVGAARGSTSLDNTKRVQPDVIMQEFDTYDQALEALGLGRIDAMTTDYLILVGLVSDPVHRGRYEIVGRFGHEPYGLAMRPDDSKFRDRINEILQELWDEGAIQSITENWFGRRGRYPADIDFTMTTFPVGR